MPLLWTNRIYQTTIIGCALLFHLGFQTKNSKKKKNNLKRHHLRREYTVPFFNVYFKRLSFHSPISWGNSSHAIATDKDIPVLIFSVNAAPIDIPSIILWRLSPKSTNKANAEIGFFSSCEKSTRKFMSDSDNCFFFFQRLPKK